MDTYGISPTFVFVWDLILIGENQLRLVLIPIMFLLAMNLEQRAKMSARFDLHPPLDFNRLQNIKGCLNNDQIARKKNV